MSANANKTLRRLDVKTEHVTVHTTDAQPAPIHGVLGRLAGFQRIPAVSGSALVCGLVLWCGCHGGSEALGPSPIPASLLSSLVWFEGVVSWASPGFILAESGLIPGGSASDWLWFWWWWWPGLLGGPSTCEPVGLRRQVWLCTAGAWSSSGVPQAKLSLNCGTATGPYLFHF